MFSFASKTQLFFLLLLLVVKALPLVSTQACSLLPTQPMIADGNDNPGWHRGLVNCSHSALNDDVIVTCLLKPRINIVSLCSWSCLALHSECLYHHRLCGPDACVLIQKGAGASMARLVHCECLPSPPCAVRVNVTGKTRMPFSESSLDGPAHWSGIWLIFHQCSPYP